MLNLQLRKLLHIFSIISRLWLTRAVLLMLLIVSAAARTQFIPISLRWPITVRMWRSMTIFSLVILLCWIVNSDTCLSCTTSLTSIYLQLLKITNCRDNTFIFLIFYEAWMVYWWVLFLPEGLSICLSWCKLINLKF